jgi:hypothetical protein
MAAHKNRAGVLNVCHACKTGDHDQCWNVQVGLEDYVCHCTTCQMPCERPACQRGPKFRTPARGWKHDDPRWG